MEYSGEEQRSIFGGSRDLERRETEAETVESDFYAQFSTHTAYILQQLHISSYAGLKTLTLYNLLHTRNAGPITARELIDFIWNKLGK